MHLNATAPFVDARRQDLVNQAARQRLSVAAACSRRWGVLVRRTAVDHAAAQPLR
jgi:hypothetical protein